MRRPSSPDGLGGTLLVVDVGIRGVVVAVLRDRAVLLVRPQVGAPRVEELDALLDALQGLDHVPFQAHEDVDGVLVGAAAYLLGVRFRLADDAPAFGFRLLGEAPLVDQERRLLLGLGDDPLGLFLGLLDDPLALGVDPLGGSDLLGYGDTQLVDQTKGGLLVDDDVVRQGQVLAVGDDRLETLDEEDDVDRIALRGRSIGSLAAIIACPTRAEPRRDACPSALRSPRPPTAHQEAEDPEDGDEPEAGDHDRKTDGEQRWHVGRRGLDDGRQAWIRLIACGIRSR